MLTNFKFNIHLFFSPNPGILDSLYLMLFSLTKFLIFSLLYSLSHAKQLYLSRIIRHISSWPDNWKVTISLNDLIVGTVQLSIKTNIIWLLFKPDTEIPQLRLCAVSAWTVVITAKDDFRYAAYMCLCHNTNILEKVISYCYL